MLRVRNNEGLFSSNIASHYIDEGTGRENFIGIGNFHEERPRQDYGNSKITNGWQQLGWIRWNSEPSKSSPIAWLIYDRADASNIKSLEINGEYLESFTTLGDGTISNSSTNNTVKYCVNGHQVNISGSINFISVGTVTFTMPDWISPDCLSTFNCGNLTIQLISSTQFTVTSSITGWNNFQISFIRS